MRSLALALVVLAGCLDAGVPAPKPDAVVPADSLTCRELADEFYRATQDQGSCDRDEDCAVVGGQALPPGEHPSCECPPMIGPRAIGRDAAGRARADEVTRAFKAHCVGAKDVNSCDFRGFVGARCVDHLCNGIPDEPCFPP